MIKESTYYNVVCDGCGRDAQEGSDYSAWKDRNQARFEPEAMDWLTGVGPDDMDFCDRCQGDEDDQRECCHEGMTRNAEKCPDCGLTLKARARAAIEQAQLTQEALANAAVGESKAEAVRGG